MIIIVLKGSNKWKGSKVSNVNLNVSNKWKGSRVSSARQKDNSKWKGNKVSNASQKDNNRASRVNSIAVVTAETTSSRVEVMTIVEVVAEDSDNKKAG